MRTDNAILVIDMLNDFVLPDAPMRVAGAEATIPAIARFTDYGRGLGWQIIYVNRLHLPSGLDAEMSRRHLFQSGKAFCAPGTKGAEVVAGLEPKLQDLLVYKTRFSAFFATNLDLLLRGLGVSRVYICGTQYPNCVRASAVDCMALDYETIVCTDCCSAASPEVAESNIRDMINMGISCVPSAEVMVRRDNI